MKTGGKDAQCPLETGVSGGAGLSGTWQRRPGTSPPAPPAPHLTLAYGSAPSWVRLRFVPSWDISFLPRAPHWEGRQPGRGCPSAFTTLPAPLCTVTQLRAGPRGFSERLRALCSARGAWATCCCCQLGGDSLWGARSLAPRSPRPSPGPEPC